VRQYEFSPSLSRRMAGLDVYGGKPASYRPDWLRPSIIPLTIVCGPPAWPAAWLIMTEPSAERRAWWAATMKPRAIVVIEADEAVCMAMLHRMQTGTSTTPC
jgi:hypothetical protein